MEIFPTRVFIILGIACLVLLSCGTANVQQQQQQQQQQTVSQANPKCHYVRVQRSHVFTLRPSFVRRLRLAVPFRPWARHLSSLHSRVVLSTSQELANPSELWRLLNMSKTKRPNLIVCEGESLAGGTFSPALLLRNSLEDATFSHIFVFLWPRHADSAGAVHSTNRSLLTVNYRCGHLQTRQCMKVDISSVYSTDKADHVRNKRSAGEKGPAPLYTSSSSSSSSSTTTFLSVLGVFSLVVVGLVALMAASAVCAQGTEPTPPTCSPNLTILSAPPPIMSEQVNNTKRPTSTTEEVRLVMDSPVHANNVEPGSPARASALADNSGNHSDVDPRNSRKSMEPLPLPPEAQNQVAQPNADAAPSDENDDHEDDEPPYDYARVPGHESDVELSENDSGDEGQEEGEAGEVKGPPGRYAKVTRHSASKETDYEPMPEFPPQKPPLPDMRERRGRSATDPLDPVFIETKPRSNTVAESASVMPLPAVPPGMLEEDNEDEVEDDMYDSIKDDLKAAIRQSAQQKPPQQEVYESVDEENGVYESVSEEVKESVHQQQTPALPTTPVPRSQQKGSSNSPSPTKRHSSPLDSPKPKKASKEPKKQASKDAKESKKKKSEGQPLSAQEAEGKSRHFSFIFSRKKTSSVSGKPEPKSPDEATSPVHRPIASIPLPSIPPPTGPRPAVPIPRPVSFTGEIDDEEEDGGMYDSVTHPTHSNHPASLSHLSASPGNVGFVSDEAVKRLAPVPHGARGGSSFNPHLNEPLPDVPEDSGSGSTGGGARVVKRPRNVEISDPSYDTVGSTRRPEPEFVDVDPNYDTVQLPQSRRQQNQQQQPLPNSITKVDTDNKPPPLSATVYSAAAAAALEKDQSLEHDEQGYAVVDPKVILRKRTSSLSKSAMQESMNEPGYEKVNKTRLSQHEEPGYESVTKSEESNEEAQYDSVEHNNEEESVQLEPGYTSVTRQTDVICMPKLVPAEPIPPSETITNPLLNSSVEEPGYESVTKDRPIDSSLTAQPMDEECEEDKPEPDYDSVDPIEQLVLTEQVEPGYASVTRQSDGVPTLEISTETPAKTQDEMYSQVNLSKKHKNKDSKHQGGSLDTYVDDQNRPTSPAPPVPAQGDLGDLSEFQPPPIPEQNFDEDTEPYATVTKPAHEEPVVSAQTEDFISDNKEPHAEFRKEETTTKETSSLVDDTVQHTQSDCNPSPHMQNGLLEEADREEVSPPITQASKTSVEEDRDTATVATVVETSLSDNVSTRPLPQNSNAANAGRASPLPQLLYDSLAPCDPPSQPTYDSLAATQQQSDTLYDSLLTNEVNS